MAKSDSFFVRAKVTSDGATFADAPIDLGFAVDALGKSVLRIHNIQAQILNEGTGFGWTPAGEEALAWNLCTQRQTTLVNCTDKSLVASGCFLTVDDSSNSPQLQSETSDINPTRFTNGYLIAVEQIYLSVDTTGAAVEADVCLMIECTVETMTAAKAMALSLSQQ